MGCSASNFRPDILQSKTTTEEPPSSSSISSFSSSHSPAAATKSSLVANTRSLSAPLVHHFPLRKGDSHHLVALTSTSYGSLVVVDRQPTAGDSQSQAQAQAQSHSTALGVGDSKDPSSPDSVINTWELMEGLDDDFDVDSGNSWKLNSSNSNYFIDAQKIPSSRNRYDSNGSVKRLSDSFVFIEKPKEMVDELGCNWNNPNSKPLWKHLSEESLLLQMDPNVASSYSRALSSRQLGYDPSRVAKSMGSSPIPSPSFSMISRSLSSSPLPLPLPLPLPPCLSTTIKSQLPLPGCEDRIVLYFTSLRGIRRTYEDCCAVRMILRGFRLRVDERDVSMDSMYRKELQSALGGKPLTLPQVFIRGNHIGGAEEIKQLHEVGELAKLLVGFPIQDFRFTCGSCGDARFLPCPGCNGSRKVFVEEEDRIRRCRDCNENGLIRCLACSS
ncbi:hypothetical protein Dimus_002135 [Dionaea muscipula]